MTPFGQMSWLRVHSGTGLPLIKQQQKKVSLPCSFIVFTSDSMKTCPSDTRVTQGCEEELLCLDH